MGKQRSNLSDAADFAIYLIYRAVGVCLSHLPLQWTFWLGQGVGWIAYFLALKYRGLALRNFQIAFPDWSDQERRLRVRQHLQNLVANVLCGFALCEWPLEKVQRYVDFADLERSNPLPHSTKGSVWLLNHIGNWEVFIFGIFLLRKGEHAVVYQELRNRFIDAYVRRIRGRNGLRLIERKEGLAGCVAVLRHGGAMGVLGDQHAGDKGIWVPFFGRLASTTPLPAILAKKVGVFIVPMAIETVGVARWRLRVEEFISPENKSIEELTYRTNQSLERQIMRNPIDWFWVHNRWKTPNPRFLLREYKRGLYLPPESVPPKPFRILVRSSNWLGDAAMTVPAVRRIKRGRPDATVTILCQAKLAEFWHLVKEVDEVIAIDSGDSLFRVASKIRGRFEAAILLPNSVRTGLEVWLARIPRRIGYKRPWRNVFLNQFVPEPKQPRPLEHQTLHYLRIAGRIGADLEEALEPMVGWTPEAGLVGLCPGAEYGPAKRWPDYHLAARQLTAERHLKWLIFGTAKESPLASRIVEQLGPQVTDLTGRTTMTELIQQLRRCQLLLTNDTGTMHLAAFLGIPTVSIFGSTEPALTGLLGSAHRVLRHHVACSPCFLRECPIDFRCMKAVTVEEVVAAVSQTLGPA
jgi:heptosyltransferase II